MGGLLGLKQRPLWRVRGQLGHEARTPQKELNLSKGQVELMEGRWKKEEGKWSWGSGQALGCRQLALSMLRVFSESQEFPSDNLSVHTMKFLFPLILCIRKLSLTQSHLSKGALLVYYYIFYCEE